MENPESFQRVGQNGPLLLQDFHLIDLLAHFDRERIPERVVHAKGAGAYGEFQVTVRRTITMCIPYLLTIITARYFRYCKLSSENYTNFNH